MRIRPLVVLLLLASCAQPGPTDPACGRAVQHVNQCAGATLLSAPDDCDPDSAAALLATSCDAVRAGANGLAADGPLDSLRAFGCAAGIVRYCPTPTCPAAPPTAGCAAAIALPGCQSCAYYACREAAHACGPDGYYTGFGHKYCERFVLTLRPRMSPAGRAFLDRARTCLMRFLEDSVPPATACAVVAPRAFASHVACYADNGFCQLPISDQLLLVNAVDPADLDLSAALHTGLACLHR